MEAFIGLVVGWNNYWCKAEIPRGAQKDDECCGEGESYSHGCMILYFGGFGGGPLALLATCHMRVLYPLSRSQIK